MYNVYTEGRNAHGNMREENRPSTSHTKNTLKGRK